MAVVGATGRMGSAVVRHLLRDGWRVRALTRDPASAPATVLGDAGAELRRVDAEQVDTLRAALSGAYGVFDVQNPMTSSTEAEIRQGGNVARAAADAGVRHVVYGAAGVGDVLTGVKSWDSKVVVAARFRGVGLPLTILRPMALMELMTDKDFYPAASVWQMMPKLMGPTRPVGWLCADDLGAVAARAFADPERWIGVDLGLVADVQSIDQCREIWRDATGRAPRGLPMPRWLFERFTGPDLTAMWDWLRTADLDLSTEPTLRVLPEAVTVREWVARRTRKGP